MVRWRIGLSTIRAQNFLSNCGGALDVESQAVCHRVLVISRFDYGVISLASSVEHGPIHEVRDWEMSSSKLKSDRIVEAKRRKCGGAA